MNKEWIGERVAVLDINRAIKNVVLRHRRFRLGPEQPVQVPAVRRHRRVLSPLRQAARRHVHAEQDASTSSTCARRKSASRTARSCKYDILITAMPLDKLCNDVINGEVPREIKKADRQPAAQRRVHGRHRHQAAVPVAPRAGCISPRDNCPFYRVTYLSNYSPYMTPDKDTHYSLLCETSYSEFKPVDGKTIVEDTIQGLINAGLIKEEDRKDIVDTWVYRRRLQLSDAQRRARRDPRAGDPVPGAARHLQPRPLRHVEVRSLQHRSLADAGRGAGQPPAARRAGDDDRHQVREHARRPQRRRPRAPRRSRAAAIRSGTVVAAPSSAPGRGTTAKTSPDAAAPPSPPLARRSCRPSNRSPPRSNRRR